MVDIHQAHKEPSEPIWKAEGRVQQHLQRRREQTTVVQPDSEKTDMATVKYVEETDAPDEIRKVYADIKEWFGLPFVPNLFKVMANHPAYLEATWARLKVIMGPGRLDRTTKEVIALAVSATNNCHYCIDAHTAALKKLGFGDAEITELMAVVDLFNGFNKLLDGLRVESDLKP